MNYYITGTRRGLGYALAQKYTTVDTLEDCDVFINCKHNEFEQVELLYKAAELNKRIINIGSNAPDELKNDIPHTAYAVQKSALDTANNHLYYQGKNTTIIRPGYFDSPRVAHINKPKIDLEYLVNLVDWVLEQPYRIKDITLTC